MCWKSPKGYIVLRRWELKRKFWIETLEVGIKLITPQFSEVSAEVKKEISV